MPRFLAAVPALPVSDERAAVRFYVQTLGFNELLDQDGRGLAILCETRWRSTCGSRTAAPLALKLIWPARPPVA